MPEESKTPSIVRFGPFELSFETGELRKNGIRKKLFGQPIQVLTLLVATPGQLVTREKLKDALWPKDTFTDFERGLNAAVSRLRENLDDSATEPQYVETVPGRGYRFIKEIEPDGSKPSRLDTDPVNVQVGTSQNYTLIAFVPKESAVGRAAEVVIWVRHELPGANGTPRKTKAESPPLGGCFFERTFELEVRLDESGTPSCYDTLLRLDAPNFKCDQPSKELSVPPGADSQPCTFLIEPCLPGDLVANLELLSKNQKILASRTIRTRALRLADDDFRSGFSISFGPLRQVYENLRRESQTSLRVEAVEASSVEQQTRLLEAAAPKESTVGCSIEVLAMVREGDSQGGLRSLLLLEKVSGLDEGDVRERPFEMEFPVDADGKALPLSISLRLESPGFEPASQIKRLRVPPTGNSPTCTFLVVPRVIGEHVMNLELIDPQEQILVSRSIRTKALPSGVQSNPERTLVTIPMLVMIRGTARDGESDSERDETSLLDNEVEGRSTVLEAPEKASKPLQDGTSEIVSEFLKDARVTGKHDQGAMMGLTGLPEEGMVLSHYRLLQVVSQGGMGTIFKAEDLRNGQVVVIRLLLKNSFAGPEQYRIEEVPPPHASRRRRWWLVASSVLVLGFLAVIVDFTLYHAVRSGVSPTHPGKTPRSVVLADFTNSTGDPAFDNLDLESDNRVPDLGRSSGTKIISRKSVDRIFETNHVPNEPFTPEMARQVCLRANAKAVVTGSISRDGNQYEITVRASNCLTGEALQTVEARAGKGDVPAVTRALTARLLEKLAK
jgi:DNA-binding winged helix-turn-helix (wHTH) protein